MSEHEEPIDAEGARRIVLSVLAEWEAAGGIPCVPVGDPVDHGDWWVQGYQSRAFVEGGDVDAALAGNGPIAVPKDGRPPFALSAASPAADQLGRLRPSGGASPSTGASES